MYQKCKQVWNFNKYNELVSYTKARQYIKTRISKSDAYTKINQYAKAWVITIEVPNNVHVIDLALSSAALGIMIAYELYMIYNQKSKCQKSKAMKNIKVHGHKWNIITPDNCITVIQPKDTQYRVTCILPPGMEFG